MSGKEIILTSAILILLLAFSLVLAEESEIKTLNVKETDLVKLTPKGYDPDNDNLIYKFSEPLNASGEWQTDYGDAGEYIITITVSDNTAESSKDVKLAVEHKNRAPQIKAPDKIEVFENGVVLLEPEFYDPDGDEVDYRISVYGINNDGAIISNISSASGKAFAWETSHEDIGRYIAEITASDGQDSNETEVLININDIDDAPVISLSEPNESEVSIKENDEIRFQVDAYDPEGKELNYSWHVNGELKDSSSIYKFKTDYGSSGEYDIAVEVSDGELNARREWKIIVENVNRAPVIEGLEDIVVSETDLVVVDFNASDPDGDEVRYNISEPIGKDKEWQTGYDDAGVYEIAVAVTDGELETTRTFTLTVVNNNRAPEINIGKDVIEINETEDYRLEFDAFDEDGEDVEYELENSPEFIALDGNAVVFKGGHDTIKKPRNFFIRLLEKFNAAEMVYKDYDTFRPVLSACDKEECAKKEVVFRVFNVNRAPVLADIGDFSVDEGSVLVMKPEASDPDGDYISFRYSKPINFLGRWSIGFSESGDYQIDVKASDGIESASDSFNLKVNNVNRAPVLDKVKNIKVKENQTVSFIVNAEDPDGDEVSYEALEIPEGAVFDGGEFVWTPDFEAVKNESRKEFVVGVRASDGNLEALRNVTITVENVNRAPVILGSSIENAGKRKLLFVVNAVDPDGDELSYEWDLGAFNKIEGKNKLLGTFQSGAKNVGVKVSDGDLEAEKRWSVRVK